jgi:hypothetical protein
MEEEEETTNICDDHKRRFFTDVLLFTFPFFLRLWRVILRGPGNFAKKRIPDPSAFSKNRRRNTAPDGSNDSLHMTHFFSSLRRD